MRIFVHQLRAEQRLFWRNKEAAFFTFFLPLILFLLLGTIFGDEHVGDSNEPFIDHLLAGILGYGAMSTGFAGLAITLVIRREDGILKRLRATPLPPWAYVGAVLTSTFVVFAIEAVLLVVLGRLAFDASLPSLPGSLIVGLALGIAAFSALGVAMTSLVRSAEGSSAVVNAVALPLAFISGSFTSEHSLPDFLRTISEFFPLIWLVRIVRGVFVDGEAIWAHPRAVAMVAAWGAAGVALALRRFRWEPTQG